MALTENNVNDLVQSAVGRPATDYETKKFSTAPIQTLANLKNYYSTLKPDQSVVDYLKHTGQDESMTNRASLASKYGISNYTGTADQNIALMNALKNPPQTDTPSISGSITPNTQPANTQGENIAAERFNKSNVNPQAGITDTSNQIPGSIAGAVNQPAQTQNTAQDTTQTTSDTQTYKDQYTTAQKAVLDVTGRINDLNKSIDSAMQNKRDEIARSGGVVDESQLRSIVLAENAPLLAERKDLLNQRSQLVGEQNIANQNYQSALKQEQLNQANQFKQEQLDLNKEKVNQSADKIAIQQQQFEEKLASSNIVKKAVYEDGTKVGETFVDKTTGQKVNVNPQTQQIIGTGTPIGIGTVSATTSNSPSQITQGKISYTDFATVPDAPIDQNRNIQYPGTAGKTYGDVYEDAVTYAQTGKYQKMGMSSKPSTKAYDNAVKTKASNIAASLGMTEQDLRTAYKANSTAVGKLITMKATVSAFENKAKAQIDMILNGYTDPTTGAKKSPLIDGASNSDYQLANKAYQTFKIQTGNTPSILLANSLITFTTEYAKIMSGSTGSASASSDSARAEASNLISNSLNKGNLEDVLGLLQKEMDTTIDGYNTQIKDTLSASSLTPKTSQIQSIPRGNMSANDYINQVLTSKGIKYDDYIKSVPAGKIPVIDNNTGETGYLDNESEVTDQYTRI